MNEGLSRQNILSIDFSNNCLGNDGCSAISHIISMHSEARDLLVWVAGLRNEYPDNIDSIHLQEVNISYNNIDDSGFNHLIQIL